MSASGGLNGDEPIALNAGAALVEKTGTPVPLTPLTVVAVA